MLVPVWIPPAAAPISVASRTPRRLRPLAIQTRAEQRAHPRASRARKRSPHLRATPRRGPLAHGRGRRCASGPAPGGWLHSSRADRGTPGPRPDALASRGSNAVGKSTLESTAVANSQFDGEEEGAGGVGFGQGASAYTTPNSGIFVLEDSEETICRRT